MNFKVQLLNMNLYSSAPLGQCSVKIKNTNSADETLNHKRKENPFRKMVAKYVQQKNKPFLSVKATQQVQSYLLLDKGEARRATNIHPSSETRRWRHHLVELVPNE